MYLAPPANHALDYRGHQEPDAQIPEILRLTQPYGIAAGYGNKAKKLDQERLASLIKACGFLLQTKVYLLWRNSASEAKPKIIKDSGYVLIEILPIFSDRTPTI
jgi:hypothetical protein